MTSFGPIGSAQNMAGSTLIQNQTKVFAQMHAKDWENRQAMPAAAPFTSTSKWCSGYNSVWGNGPPYPEDLYWSTLNNELEVFPTGDAIREITSSPVTDPFTSWNGDGSLNIVPRPLTSAETATMTGANTAVWSRVMLNSGAFATWPYGLTPPYLVEIRCKMPTAKGTWPAFWLIPTSGAWPPELDVFEGNSGQLTTSVHSTMTNWQADAISDGTTFVGSDSATQNLAGDISAWGWYGAAVYADHVGIFVNRALVKVWTTPSDFTTPMHLMADYAVGGPGDWVGTPDNPLGPYAPFVISDIGIYAMPATYGTGLAPGAEPSQVIIVI